MSKWQKCGRPKLIITNNTIKKCFDFAGKKLHAPEQRMLIGATALVTQPWIDSKNNDVDTRDFVLGKFSNKEEEIINNSFSKLKDLINDFCYLGNNGLMNKYNNK